MKLTRFLPALALACACCLALTACETPGKRKRSDTKTIDRQGVKTIAVLAHYLFPVQWDEAMQVAMARRMYPLEYHGSANRGRAKIQAKAEFDGGALQQLLVDVRKSTKTFAASAAPDETFRKDAPLAELEDGIMVPLTWWKPSKQKNAAYYSWVAERPGEAPARVWLQVADGKKNIKTVYVRIESE